MKRSIVRTFAALTFSAILSPLALLAQDQLNATIPFNFTVGTKSLTAGEYSVHHLNDGHTLLIRNRKDGTSIMTAVMGGEPSKKAGTSVLTFKRYGDSYFLSGISGANQGWQLFQSAAEKELIAKATTPKPVLVAASK